MKVPILMYHKIEELNPQSIIPGHYVSPALFAKHLRILDRLKYQVIDFRNLFGPGNSNRRVVITFDDGYENFYTNALPLLERFQFPSTVFLVSNQIGGCNQWDVANGDVQERLMSESQVKECAGQLVEFGSHTADHADLSAIDRPEAVRQLQLSKAEIERILNHQIETFCYPYGRKKPETEALVAAAGYQWACSTDKGVNSPETNPMALKRINVRRETSAPVFMYKLWRGYAFGK